MSPCGCTSFCQLRFTWREFRKRTFILSAWAYLSFQGFWIFHYYSGLLAPPVWLQGPSVCWGNWERGQAVGTEGKAKLFIPQTGRFQRGALQMSTLFLQMPVKTSRPGRTFSHQTLWEGSHFLPWWRGRIDCVSFLASINNITMTPAPLPVSPSASSVTPLTVPSHYQHHHRHRHHHHCHPHQHKTLLNEYYAPITRLSRHRYYFLLWIP